MSSKNKPQELPDRIPADFGNEYDTRFEKSFAAHVGHEDFRKRVKEIFDDCTETVAFKAKIKEYAGESFNDKLFKNWWSLLLFLGTLIVTGLIGRLIK